MAAFDDTLLEEHEHRAARVVASALLADAAAQRERLAGRGNSDPEALHDFRVAVRRLRSWLRAERDVLEDSVPKRARRWLRRVAEATNGSRDAEVFAEWVAAEKGALTARQRVGAAWLLERIARARNDAELQLTAEVERDFERVRELLDERLPVYRIVYHLDEGVRGPSFAGAMAALTRAHAATLRRRLGVHDASDDTAIHRARIAGKRLRYLLEPIAPHVPGGGEVIDQLKTLQDALGDLHDANAWLAMLRDAIEAAGRERAKELANAAGTGLVPARSSAARRDPRPGLVTMAELVRVRAGERFAALERDWLGDATPPLFGGLERIAAALEARGRSGIEIERKYLLSQLPAERPPAQVREIAQGYLPGERLIERLRRVESNGDARYYRTVKVGVGIERTELEDQCSRDVFEVMWPLTLGKRVAKRRHVVREGDAAWELDEFTDRELVLAEIELPSADAVPEIPGWLAPFVVREVTGESEYVNANLAM
jgi:CHAD domain-containing protein/CYTH domain-containing protein